MIGNHQGGNMRNHLYDVTNIAELIRWDVVITPDDQYVESEENTFIDGVFEDPDTILTRIELIHFVETLLFPGKQYRGA